MSEESIVDGWEEVDCLLCGRKTPEMQVVLADAEHGNIVRCRSCGIVFRSPRRREHVRPDQIGDRWFPESAPEDVIRIYRSVILKRMGRLVLNYHPAPGSILDIGSSYGHFLSQFSSAWRRYGVEPSSRACRGAQELVPEARFCNSLLAAAPLSDGPYDVITLIDCIYLLPHPLQDCARLARFLRPDGLIFIEAPNVNNKLFIYGLLKRHLQASWMYFYDGASLEKLMNRAGIETVARIDFPSNSINDPNWRRRLLAWSEWWVSRALRLISFGKWDYVSHFILIGKVRG